MDQRSTDQLDLALGPVAHDIVFQFCSRPESNAIAMSHGQVAVRLDTESAREVETDFQCLVSVFVGFEFVGHDVYLVIRCRLVARRSFHSSRWNSLQSLRRRSAGAKLQDYNIDRLS